VKLVRNFEFVVYSSCLNFSINLIICQWNTIYIDMSSVVYC